MSDSCSAGPPSRVRSLYSPAFAAFDCDRRCSLFSSYAVALATAASQPVTIRKEECLIEWSCPPKSCAGYIGELMANRSDRHLPNLTNFPAPTRPHYRLRKKVRGFPSGPPGSFPSRSQAEYTNATESSLSRTLQKGLALRERSIYEIRSE